jgi:hypothetical protein
MGHPTIYPTGTTVYLPEKAWSGYTISQAGFSTGGKERAVRMSCFGMETGG